MPSKLYHLGENGTTFRPITENCIPTLNNVSIVRPVYRHIFFLSKKRFAYSMMSIV